MSFMWKKEKVMRRLLNNFVPGGNTVGSVNSSLNAGLFSLLVAI